jgi:transcriptional regulator GlxA family with amidase domain
MASRLYYAVVPGQRNVAILLFDEVEVLDFAGPFEVFSVCGRRDGSDPFSVYTVAAKEGTVSARNGLVVEPSYTLANCPAPDLAVVPGGFGSRSVMTNPMVLDWLRQVADTAELMLSVCTGSLVLAKAGLLDGLEATTHHGALDLLESVAPETTVRRDLRVVDNGHVITSAGVSAGMDMSFHVIARLLGEDQARETAEYIEYPWQGSSD